MGPGFRRDSVEELAFNVLIEGIRGERRVGCLGIDANSGRRMGLSLAKPIRWPALMGFALLNPSHDC